MFVNRCGRRRLPALWGRDMADDGRAARLTVTTAGTSRVPTRAGTRRDVIRRRAIPHTIRHRAIGHATSSMDAIRRRTIRHAMPIPDAVPGDRPYRTRRSFFYPTMSGCPDMPGHARICPDMPGRCPEYARTMPGRCPDRPDDVSLPGLSGDCVTGSERPNGSPEPRRRTSHTKARRPCTRIDVRQPLRAASAPGAVGPGHGRRRACGSPNRDHGRDIEGADTGRDTTRRE